MTVKSRGIAEKIVAKLERIGLWHFIVSIIAVSELFTAIIVAAMSLLFHGRVTGDYLITGAVTSLAVSGIIAVVVVTLIEEYRKTAAALIDGEARLQYLLTNSPAVIYTCLASNDYATTFISDNVREQLGYEPRDFLDDPGFWLANVHPEDVRGVLARMPGLFERGCQSCEYRFRHSDGAYRWMRDELRLIRDASGRPVTIVGTWIDITQRRQIAQELEEYRTQLETMVEGRTFELRQSIALLKAEVEERRKAEKELMRSEEQFRSVVETSKEGVFFIDAASDTILYANQAMADMLGKVTEELTGRHICELHPPDRMEQICEDFAKHKTGEKTRSTDIPFLHRNGSLVWTEVSTNHIALGGTKFQIGFFRDITERRRAEKELREKEEKMRAMLESFDGYLYICSQDYRVEFMNDNLVRRTGRNAVGEYCYAVLNDRDSICPWCVKERVLRGETVRYEVQSPKDGLWYQVVNTPIRHADGSLSKQAMFLDITERKRADVALQESEERYRRLLASVTDYIYTVAVEDGRPVAMNHGEGCNAVTGYSPEQYCADPSLWYRTVYETDRRAVAQQQEKALSGERTAPLEHRVVHHNGTLRWVCNTLMPRFDGQGNLICLEGLITDITEKRTLEDQLRKAQQLKEENLRIFTRLLIDVQEEERRAIARELHDEIGQSLTGLKFSVESMADSAPSSEQANSLRVLEASLGELLAFVRNMSLDLRPAMLDDFGLTRTFRWYFERFESQTGMTVDFWQTGRTRRLGRQKEIALYRIMQEALTNTARHAGVRNVLVELVEKGNRLMLRIEDAGRGFDMTGPAAAFSSGLSIMRERAILLSGTFSVSSTPGKGTEITVTIPLDDGDGGKDSGI